MPKFLAKNPAPVDVLVVGDHPCAYLAAALLAQKSDLRIVLAALPDAATEDRLVVCNPALFDLHPLLTSVKQKLRITNVYGLNFLSDRADTASEHRVKSTVACVVRRSEMRDQFAKCFDAAGFETLPANAVNVRRIDEHGLEVCIGKHEIQARAMILAGEEIEDEKRLIGRPATWGPDVVHRFTLARCKSGKHLKLTDRALMPMSLDLRGKLNWGWLLPGDGEFQLVVEQPVEAATAASGQELMAHWIAVLKSHLILGTGFDIKPSAMQTLDFPLAGALAHEGVANRTLLIGPAGGFYSACGEEIYPACWSALFAAEVLKKALKEKHLQDALNPYRHQWRTTLGDYLRGPHQNLRFLLPLVYRNPAMTVRIAEAILLSKSVVR